jgi:broad specificity phosphatase PhoE
MKYDFPMRPNRILIIRHGESQGNVDRNQYKSIPDYALNLTARGIEQARQAGKELQAILGNQSLYVYLSPFIRTRQTFQYL